MFITVCLEQLCIPVFKILRYISIHIIIKNKLYWWETLSTRSEFYLKTLNMAAYFSTLAFWLREKEVIISMITEWIEVCYNHRFAFSRIFAIIPFIHAFIAISLLILLWTVSKAAHSNNGIIGLIELTIKIKCTNTTKNA